MRLIKLQVLSLSKLLFSISEKIGAYHPPGGDCIHFLFVEFNYNLKFTSMLHLIKYSNLVLEM